MATAVSFLSWAAAVRAFVEPSFAATLLPAAVFDGCCWSLLAALGPLAPIPVVGGAFAPPTDGLFAPMGSAGFFDTDFPEGAVFPSLADGAAAAFFAPTAAGLAARGLAGDAMPLPGAGDGGGIS